MKKVIAFCLIVALIVAMPFSVSANQNDDLVDHSLEEEMRSVIDRGIMRGYRDGVYGPDDSITRAQFATFIARALNLPTGSSDFDDVADDYLLRGGISRAASAGIVGGYPGNVFHPDENITREQMAVMIDRALEYQNVSRNTVHLSFTDVDNIHPMYRTAIAHNVYFGIIQGMPRGDGTYQFGPKDHATRAHAAAFIDRMLHVAENDGERIVHYQLATIDQQGNVQFAPQQYTSFDDANNQRSNQQVIYLGQDMIKMNDGIVTAAPSEGNFIVIIYDEDRKTQLAYVNAGAEMEYLDADEDFVKVQFADAVGYVEQTEVMLTPTALLEGQSYYKNVDGDLLHYIYNPLTNRYVSYMYGPAPSFLEENQEYTSINGWEFYNRANQKVGEARQYFNYLPLRTKTNYSAEELNEYIKAVRPDSPLAELGHVFKEAEEEYELNALYLLAKAIHESNYAQSQIAQEKYNLFGLRATDSDPLRNAETFDSFEDSIMYIADYVSQRYVDPNGWYFNSAVLGNKSIGLNVSYASDPFWGQKIAGHMYRADKFLGQKDLNYYTIGKTTSFLNVRHEPNTNIAAQFTYPNPGVYLAILEESTQADGTWYKIYSDHMDFTHAHVHGDYVTEITTVR
ncbi:S-layer homology domain-containing protein [Desertibacillus haloalkaliphilus]|uniref:S-layer homology domain-containing protein n=1 Tax=Desertibacillus haloalkaliphilus TaxID=1328930 RepID=UPI001C27D306|nr:S-layer homology domain-containing protein [Desertibacillus haloalkaliphilus]MBU8905966.1 S-layer homology domain-containing protein [Desertibacillus haloalkaliphilus]